MYAHRGAGLGDFFDDVEKYINKASDIVGKVKAGYQTAEAVKRGEKQVVVVPTRQAVVSGVSSAMPVIVMALAGVAVASLFLRRGR